MERARAKLEYALAYAPESAEVNTALGNYWLHANDRGRAKWFYLRALQLDPRTLNALNNLAVLEITEGRLDLAKILLNAALQIEPDDIKLAELKSYCERKLQKNTPPSPSE